LASARRSTGFSAAGSAASSIGGASWRCLKMVAIGVSARKGTWPVKISKMTTPSA
jgi:hypothetical protein